MPLLEIEETVVPIASAIRNAYIDFSRMTVSVVRLLCRIGPKGRPVAGYGFNSNGRYAQQGILRERILPRLKEARPQELLDESGENLDPFKAGDVMLRNEKPGGHGERSVAVGVVDMALWDCVAKIAGKPLHRLLAERFGAGEPAASVFVYAAGGYYHPGKDLEGLKAEMRGYLEAGYRTVKMKIGGATLAEDLRRIEAVGELLEGDFGRLAVDANGRFGPETALAYAKALQPYGLAWYEEPGDPLDYALLSEVAEHYGGPLATGENLFSRQDVANLLRYGGLRRERDILQMDPALSYGLVEYLAMLRVLQAAGWSAARCIPHGGHQFALAIAAGLGLGGNESYPGIFQPFGGFADGLPVEEGRVSLPEVPGVGFEAKCDLMALFHRSFSKPL